MNRDSGVAVIVLGCALAIFANGAPGDLRWAGLALAFGLVMAGAWLARDRPDRTA